LPSGVDGALARHNSHDACDDEFNQTQHCTVGNWRELLVRMHHCARDRHAFQQAAHIRFTDQSRQSQNIIVAVVFDFAIIRAACITHL